MSASTEALAHGLAMKLSSTSLTQNRVRFGRDGNFVVRGEFSQEVNYLKSHRLSG